MRQAGCPEGFRFANPDGFDLGAKLRQSEPYKSLLGGPLPSRRVPPQPAQQPIQQMQRQHPPPAPGVLAEQPPNQPQGQRRSGFQVPSKPGGRESGGSGLDAFRPQARQPPPPYPGAQPAAAGRPSAPAPQEGRWGQDSRWGAKLPRRAADMHVHQSRQRGSSGEEEAPQGSSGDDGGEEERACGTPGFQTARARLAADMAKRGEYGGGGGGAMGPPPRAGLARPGGGSRPAGLRKTGEGLLIGLSGWCSARELCGAAVHLGRHSITGALVAWLQAAVACRRAARAASLCRPTYARWVLTAVPAWPGMCCSSIGLLNRLARQPRFATSPAAASPPQALEAQNGNGEEAAEGPLSERTLSILKLGGWGRQLGANRILCLAGPMQSTHGLLTSLPLFTSLPAPLPGT